MVAATDTMRPGMGEEPAEFTVDEIESLTFARRYGSGADAFTVYRSDFPDAWGFDYEVTGLEDRPRELVWVESGMMTAHAGAKRWTLVPSHAMWMPAGETSDVIPNLRSRAFCVQFDAAHPAFDPDEPTLVRVSPLARELLLRLGSREVAAPAALLARDLLLTELVATDSALHQLPLPADARIRGIAARLLADPADDTPLSVLATGAYCSTKTVQRAFTADTGMSFVRWRRVARVLASLPMLDEGTPVRHVAARVGFADVGAYISAFRAHFGVTPGRHRTGAREPAR